MTVPARGLFLHYLLTDSSVRYIFNHMKGRNVAAHKGTEEMKTFKVKVQVEIEVQAKDIDEAHRAVSGMRASFDYTYGTSQGKTGYHLSNGVFIKLLSKHTQVADTEVVS